MDKKTKKTGGFVDKLVEDEMNFEAESSEEDENVDENIGKVIYVPFEGQPISSSDFHGVKCLLHQLFVRHINEELSELTNLIVSQDFIGSVLKQDYPESTDDSEESSDDEADENVYGLTTVVNISENQSLSCIDKIKDLLSLKCEENYKEEPARMKVLLNDPTKQIGLLLSERFINLPANVAYPSFNSLRNDIEEAVKNKKKFRFTHFILISKTFRSRGDSVSKELFYTNPEEELFTEVCDFSYTYSVADQRDTLTDGDWDDEGEDFEALRTVMVFDASAFGHIISKLETYCNQLANKK